MVVLLMLAGLGEGLGVASLLPMINMAIGEPISQDPSAIAQAVDAVLGSLGLSPTLGLLLGLIVVGMTLKALFLWLAMQQIGFTVARVTRDLRLDLVRALLAARWRYFGETPVGEFANAIGSEAIRAAAAYREACVVMGALLQILVYFAVAALIEWRVSLGAVIVGSLVAFALRRWVAMGRSAGVTQTNLSKSMTGRLVDALKGLKSVKAMAREHLFWPLLEREAEGLNEAQRRQIIASEGLKLFQEPLVTLVLAGMLYGALTLTTLPFSAVLVLAFVSYRLIQHMNTLQMRYQIMAVGESAFWSLRDAVNRAERERELRSGNPPPKPLTEEIRFESVSFRYGEEPVLADVSLSIPRGGFVTLTGPSGAGKTTLVDLIAGLYSPTKGDICVDGTLLAQLDLRGWRRCIGYVPQDPLLFNTSILNNVTLGDENVSRERVRQVLQAAGAWDFVQRRPAGLDDVVGEAGGYLSGGQRQRIAIARALVYEPTLLILDEVTTALDPDTEAEICQTLLRLRGRVTVVAISHQTAMRNAADVVYTVRDTRVTVQRGKTSTSTSLSS